MPQALISFHGYSIYFRIGNGDEPVHVHVSRKQQAGATKFRIASDGVELAKDTGTVDKQDMKTILRYLRKNKEQILSRWIQYFHAAEVKR